MENMINVLMAQGISRELAESMLLAFKPKKEKSAKKGNGFFTKKEKITKDVEVTVVCECCGAVEVQTKSVECVNGDSPSTMKLPVSSCPNCIPFFRAMSHETLVSLALAAHNPSVRHSHPRTQSKVKLAKRLTPEEMLNYTVTHH